MTRLISCLALAALAASTPAVAKAGSATAAESVSLTVQGNCSITNTGGAGNFTFGTINAGTSGLGTATGTLQYSCSSGTTPALAFNDSAPTSTSNFTLVAGASKISYQLCLAANFTSTGSGSCSTPIVNASTSTFAPPAQPNIALEAFFPYSSGLAAGTYADSITATLTF
jgi:spore coat protein U-like protein